MSKRTNKANRKRTSAFAYGLNMDAVLGYGPKGAIRLRGMIAPRVPYKYSNLKHACNMLNAQLEILEAVPGIVIPGGVEQESMRIQRAYVKRWMKFYGMMNKYSPKGKQS